MVQRLALLFGSVAAAAVLAVALAAAGFAPGSPAPATATPAAPALVQAAFEQPPAGPQATPQPTTQVDTVYVKPAPPRRTIRIVKAAPTQPPIVVQRVVRVATAGGENDGEND